MFSKSPRKLTNEQIDYRIDAGYICNCIEKKTFPSSQKYEK